MDFALRNNVLLTFYLPFLLALSTWQQSLEIALLGSAGAIKQECITQEC